MDNAALIRSSTVIRLTRSSSAASDWSAQALRLGLRTDGSSPDPMLGNVVQPVSFLNFRLDKDAMIFLLEPRGHRPLPCFKAPWQRLRRPPTTLPQ